MIRGLSKKALKKEIIMHGITREKIFAVSNYFLQCQSRDFSQKLCYMISFFSASAKLTIFSLSRFFSLRTATHI